MLKIQVFWSEGLLIESLANKYIFLLYLTINLNDLPSTTTT